MCTKWQPSVHISEPFQKNHQNPLLRHFWKMVQWTNNGLNKNSCKKQGCTEEFI